MVRKAEELEIAHQGPTLETQVARDHRFHLIKQQLLRHAAHRQKRVLEASEQRAHVLARTETTPQQPRVPEHDQ